jgi:RNA polymerase sigma factor (sigma-70 family)
MDAQKHSVEHVVEHLFRQEAGKMVATLTGIFGVENLGLAEDVVQEALVRAMQTWPFYGIPGNPSAWIMRTSRNLALDVVRRRRVFREKEPEISRLMDRPMAGPDEAIFSEHEIADDRLRLMFVCCHPLVPEEARVALALKTLCGFSIPEISRAFLSSDAAIAKRLTRAKQKIRDARIPFEIPAGDELGRRLDAVLQSIYLLFNEGYKASSGEGLVRAELCQEAIRLAKLLVEHPAGRRPKSDALLALMYLSAARLPARVDEHGHLLRLEDQPRDLWDRGMIAQGMFHLARSASGREVSDYHLQARIAACHCSARDYASTDWPQILSLYDRLADSDNSPVVALNRAVAVANVHGPEAALSTIEAISGRAQLKSYYLLYAVLGELEFRRRRFETAADHFRMAIELVDLPSERLFLAGKLQSCRSQPASVGSIRPSR